MSTQVISGTHVSAEGVSLVGRTVTATPIPKQFVDGRTVDVVPLSTLTGAGGAWSLTVVQGIVYDVRIERWATHTIKVTTDSALDFSYYLDLSDNVSIPGPISQIALRAGAYTPGRQLQFDTTGRVVASDYAVGAAGSSDFSGVAVATTEPAGLVSYAQWLAGGRVGYWAWIDVSGGGSTTTASQSVSSYGGLVLGGSSTASSGRAAVALGGLVLGGTSLVSVNYAPVSRSVTSLGGVVLGGSSPVAYGTYGSTSVTSSGGLVLGGSSVVTQGSVRALTGGLVLGGTSAVSFGRSVTSLGGLVLGGVSSVSAGPAVTAVGGLVLGGASTVARGAVRSSAGGLVLGGSSPAVGTANVTSSQAVTSVGGLVLGGTSVGAGETAALGNSHVTNFNDGTSDGWGLTVGVGGDGLASSDPIIEMSSNGTKAAHWHLLAGYFSDDGGYYLDAALAIKTVSAPAGVVSFKYLISAGATVSDFKLTVNGTDFLFTPTVDGGWHTGSIDISSMGVLSGAELQLCVFFAGPVGSATTADVWFDDISVPQ